MNGSERQIFPARRDALQAALAFVEAFCEFRGVAAGDMLRLTLIVEELFTNTIMHGHRGDSEAPVHIALSAETTQLSLCYEDAAPPFDPLQFLAERPPGPASPIDKPEPGGQGLPLIAQMSERFDYLRVDGCNRLRVLIRRGA
jgi:serine/threonine-protein kinase RsbW